MRKPVTAVIASIVLVSLLAACGGNVAPTRQIDDALLAENVRNAIGADRELARYELSVNVNGSNVILMGVVASNAHRDRAEAITRTVTGVETVDNRIEVRR